MISQLLSIINYENINMGYFNYDSDYATSLLFGIGRQLTLEYLKSGSNNRLLLSMLSVKVIRYHQHQTIS